MAEQDAESSLVALALAVESEVDLAAALELSRALEMIRRSPTFSSPQRAEAKILVARHCWALATAARKEKGGNLASPNLKDAVASSRASKVETATSAVETRKRDEDARGAAKEGDAGKRQLAAKGRGDQPGQGGKFGKDVGNSTRETRWWFW